MPAGESSLMLIDCIEVGKLKATDDGGYWGLLLCFPQPAVKTTETNINITRFNKLRLFITGHPLSSLPYWPSLE